MRQTTLRYLGLLLTFGALFGLILLFTAIAVQGQGQAIACYGDLDGLAWYPSNTPVAEAAVLDMQLWPAMGWFESWIPDAYWLAAMRAPGNHAARFPLIMFYGQRHSPEVIVLVGNVVSHTATGWHPCGVTMISHAAFEELR